MFAGIPTPPLPPSRLSRAISCFNLSSKDIGTGLTPVRSPSERWLCTRTWGRSWLTNLITSFMRVAKKAPLRSLLSFHPEALAVLLKKSTLPSENLSIAPCWRLFEERDSIPSAPPLTLISRGNSRDIPGSGPICTGQPCGNTTLLRNSPTSARNKCQPANRILHQLRLFSVPKLPQIRLVPNGIYTPRDAQRALSTKTTPA